MIMSKQVQITKNEIPPNWQLESADFINKLLQRKPMDRLGIKGIHELKEHAWFKNYNWEGMINGTTKSPFIPVSSENIDKNYLNQREKIGVNTKERYLEIIKSDLYKVAFEGFFYIDSKEEELLIKKYLKRKEVVIVEEEYSNNKPYKMQRDKSSKNLNLNKLMNKPIYRNSSVRQFRKSDEIMSQNNLKNSSLNQNSFKYNSNNGNLVNNNEKKEKMEIKNNKDKHDKIDKITNTSNNKITEKYVNSTSSNEFISSFLKNHSKLNNEYSQNERNVVKNNVNVNINNIIINNLGNIDLESLKKEGKNDEVIINVIKNENLLSSFEKLNISNLDNLSIIGNKTKDIQYFPKMESNIYGFESNRSNDKFKASENKSENVNYEFDKKNNDKTTEIFEYKYESPNSNDKTIKKGSFVISDYFKDKKDNNNSNKDSKINILNVIKKTDNSKVIANEIKDKNEKININEIKKEENSNKISGTKAINGTKIGMNKSSSVSFFGNGKISKIKYSKDSLIFNDPKTHQNKIDGKNESLLIEKNVFIQEILNESNSLKGRNSSSLNNPDNAVNINKEIEKLEHHIPIKKNENNKIHTRNESVNGIVNNGKNDGNNLNIKFIQSNNKEENSNRNDSKNNEGINNKSNKTKNSNFISQKSIIKMIRPSSSVSNFGNLSCMINIKDSNKLIDEKSEKNTSNNVISSISKPISISSLKELNPNKINNGSKFKSNFENVQELDVKSNDYTSNLEKNNINKTNGVESLNKNENKLINNSTSTKSKINLQDKIISNSKIFVNYSNVTNDKLVPDSNTDLLKELNGESNIGIKNTYTKLKSKSKSIVFEEDNNSKMSIISSFNNNKDSNTVNKNNVSTSFNNSNIFEMKGIISEFSKMKKALFNKPINPKSSIDGKSCSDMAEITNNSTKTNRSINDKSEITNNIKEKEDKSKVLINKSKSTSLFSKKK